MTDNNDTMNALMSVPSWAVMWGIACLLFVAAKMAMLLRVAGLRGWRGWAWLLAWPGMETRCWLGDLKSPAPEMPLRWHAGLLSMLAGVLLVWWVARLLPWPLASGWVGMIGMVLMLHFGLFRWLAGFWQRRGVAVSPLMHRPLAARSVAEFWGARWNQAFRDLARDLVGRSLTRKRGVRRALWVVFFASGLLHELVISVPAGAGYGWPTLYFLGQALAIEVEKAWRFQSRVWLVLVTFAPVFLLFHPPFVARVILPFLQAIGALS